MRIEGGVVEQTYNQPSQTQSRTESTQVVKPEVRSESVSLRPQRVEDVQVQPERKVDEHEVIQAIEKANKHIRMYDRKLEFTIHEGTHQIMVKVIDTENDQVIREIPSEKILDMVAHLWEMAGILVDEKR